MMGFVMLVCGSAFAEEVVINFDDDYQTLFPTIPGVSSSASAQTGAEACSDGDFTGVTTSTAVQGVTVTVAPAEDAKTPSRIWNSSPRLRMYSGTFTVSGTDITKIVFDAGSNFNLSTTQGTLSDKTWTGEKTNEVVFSVSKNTQIRKITVTLGEGGEVTPPNPEVEQITVAQALSIIDGLADGGKTDKEYQVKGYVVTVTEINASYGNATFTMADAKGGSPVLTYFRGKGFNGADISNTELVKVDDEVVVQGLLQKYVKNEEVTPEVAQGGKIISINDKTEDDKPVEVTTAADIAAFKALESGTTAKLTLTNAQVLFGTSTDIFVRDASGAIDFYNTGLTLSAGQIINGSVIGKLTEFKGMPELAKTNDTNADGYTVSEGTATPKDIGIDEVSGFECDLVVLKGVTLVQDGNNWYATNEDGDRVQVFDKFKIGYTPETGKTFDVTGIVIPYSDAYEIAPINDFIGGGNVDTPATPVANITALLDMGDTPNLELTLTNAKVLFNDGNYIYVRENGKALCFYKIDGLKDVAKNNAVINGKIEVDYEVYKLLPEVKSNKNTNLNGLSIEESEEAAEPVQTTLAEVAAGNNVCDLVTLTANLIREIPTKEDGTEGTPVYYLEDGNTRIVVVNNGKGLNKLADNAVETVVVTGIVNTNNNAYQLKLTKQAADASGINNITIDSQNDGLIFNLAGQRVEKIQKGVNIVGGKKLLVK